MGSVDGRWHGDYDEIGLTKRCGIGCDGQILRGAQFVSAYLPGGIDVLFISSDLSLVEIYTLSDVALAEFHGERKTDISQSHDGDLLHGVVHSKCSCWRDRNYSTVTDFARFRG